MNEITHSLLGKKTIYVSHYDPSLLFPIAREIQRQQLALSAQLPFTGADIWSAYELSWLNPRGKPLVATADIIVPCNTNNLVESKSLKLYLNSYNQSSFDSIESVQRQITSDLSEAVGGPITVQLYPSTQRHLFTNTEFKGICLDTLDIDIDTYKVKPNFLQLDAHRQTQPSVNEVLYSHLLKSDCPATGQPDWGNLIIHYQGPAIDHEGLLRYIISFREHAEFAEHCVERIFMDIQQHCRPEKLSVYARYTRRGGLDINPFRSNFQDLPQNLRCFRQ
ncbi:MAG: NADPH-dependent 7-cyano-7-deazaguanine reductase QueF [Gammaproteobacteria bacterium]